MIWHLNRFLKMTGETFCRCREMSGQTQGTRKTLREWFRLGVGVSENNARRKCAERGERCWHCDPEYRSLWSKIDGYGLIRKYD